MAKLEAIAPVMFSAQSDVECLLWASEKIIIESAIIIEATNPKRRNFKVNLWP
jgi:hypothetical protein